VSWSYTNTKIFADDAKLYSEIDLGLNDCSLSLQTSLDNLATSAFAWQLSINVQKCCVLSTVINKRSSHSGSIKHYLNEVLLTNNVNVLDLGISIAYTLIYRTTRINPSDSGGGKVTTPLRFS